MKPHKHAEVIKAWADGAEIEQYILGQWVTLRPPMWHDMIGDEVLRVKPREFPKTSLTYYQLREVYSKEGGSFTAIANAAIKQYILDTEKAQ